MLLHSLIGGLWILTDTVIHKKRAMIDHLRQQPLTHRRGSKAK